ncbi:MAG: phosphoribosyltransferase [Anaerolineae bacterium]
MANPVDQHCQGAQVTDGSEKLIVTWDDVEDMCRVLGERLQGEEFDKILGVARGGLIPTALLAQELGARDVLVASLASYQADERGDDLAVLEFPVSEILAGKRVLIVDDVWDSGRTLELTRRLVEEAGGEPKVAVLHYKPRMSRFPELAPDYWLAETDDWVVYPWERGN